MLEYIRPTALTRAEEIIREVSLTARIPVSEILGPRRMTEIVRARQYAQWRIHRETGMSLPRIGRIFHRNHTSVLNSLRRVESFIKENSQ